MRATFAEEVEDKHIAILQVFDHITLRILVPCLYYPYSLWVHFLHGLHDDLSGGIVVYLANHLTFMEGVHGVIVGFAEQGFLFFII